jgi:glycosylphosphatidylinositol deacylase
MAKDAGATVSQVSRSSPLRVTPNRTSTPRISPLASFLALLSLGSLAALYLSFTSIQPVYPPGSLAVDARGGSAGSCRMTYMSPSYLRLDGFGANQTRLGGGPWGLYLYREAGWDEEPFLDDGTLALTGSPVFFVPGNAGSFRQVRSIASTVARTWWITPGVERSRAGHVEGAGPVDFFTLDFNDDFSAFHGQTLLDQAEYLADAIKFVLGLYGERAGRVKAESVVVVAHSMGGIVARAAFLDPKYRPKSISTILSIATPHIVPPVTVDPSVGTVYDAVTSYWRRGHGLESNDDVSVVQELEDVVLISIGGGVSDVMVASEAVSVKSLLPAKDTHGFTVLTTSIAGVQTPIDHLAILWCQQLVQIIADSLLSIVDTRTPRGVVPRKERIASLGFRLLGEVERGKGVVASASVSLEMIEGGIASTRITEGERLVIRERVQERTTYVLHFPPIPISTFLLTASAKIDAGPDGVEVYACHVSDPTRSGCSPLFPSHASDLPLSLRADTSPLIPAAIEEGVMGFVGIDVSQLGGMDSVVVVVKPGMEWLVAEFDDKTTRLVVVNKTATRESSPTVHVSSATDLKVRAAFRRSEILEIPQSVEDGVGDRSAGPGQLSVGDQAHCRS